MYYLTSDQKASFLFAKIKTQVCNSLKALGVERQANVSIVLAFHLNAATDSLKPNIST